MAYMSHGRANAENLLEFMDSQCWPMLEILAIFLGQPMLADVTFGLHFSQCSAINSIIDGPPDTNIHPSLMGQPTSADREYSSEIHGSAGVGQDDIFNRAFKKH